jgi:hypothetical protein
VASTVKPAGSLCEMKLSRHEPNNYAWHGPGRTLA